MYSIRRSDHPPRQPTSRNAVSSRHAFAGGWLALAHTTATFSILLSCPVYASLSLRCRRPRTINLINRKYTELATQQRTPCLCPQATHLTLQMRGAGYLSTPYRTTTTFHDCGTTRRAHAWTMLRQTSRRHRRCCPHFQRFQRSRTFRPGFFS